MNALVDCIHQCVSLPKLDRAKYTGTYVREELDRKRNRQLKISEASCSFGDGIPIFLPRYPGMKQPSYGQTDRQTDVQVIDTLRLSTTTTWPRFNRTTWQWWKAGDFYPDFFTFCSRFRLRPMCVDFVVGRSGLASIRSVMKRQGREGFFVG